MILSTILPKSSCVRRWPTVCQAATSERHQRTEAGNTLRRAFDYYIETKDLGGGLGLVYGQVAMAVNGAVKVRLVSNVMPV